MTDKAPYQVVSEEEIMSSGRVTLVGEDDSGAPTFRVELTKVGLRDRIAQLEAELARVHAGWTETSRLRSRLERDKATLREALISIAGTARDGEHYRGGKIAAVTIDALRQCSDVARQALKETE